jgi:hypothetical protein
VADYDEQGALSEENLATLAAQFDLPQPILQTLSIELGNSLNAKSIVNLTTVYRDVAVARAHKALEKSPQLAKRVEQDLAKMVRILAPLSDAFVANRAQQGVLAAAKQRTEAAQTAAAGLHDAGLQHRAAALGDRLHDARRLRRDPESATGIGAAPPRKHRTDARCYRRAKAQFSTHYSGRR